MELINSSFGAVRHQELKTETSVTRMRETHKGGKVFFTLGSETGKEEEE